MSKEKQLGFFISQDGSTLHGRRKTGDITIRPKEKKHRFKPKHKKSGPTPYEEVMRFVEAQRKHRDQEGLHIETTLDGDESHILVTAKARHTVYQRGERDETDLRPVKETIIYDPTANISLDQLSQKARGLYFKFKKEGKI